MNLSRFPRVRLAHRPTPIEPLPNLSRHLGGPTLFVKRDDCTGLALGGNKVRKLEFLLGDALAQGATHVVTHGATQSNHVRQTAAAARKLGLRCTALLEERVIGRGVEYEDGGNVLLDRIFGCTLETRPGGSDMNAELAAIGERLRASGERPYLIPGGGSTPVRALGYVAAAQELLVQSNDLSLPIDRVVHASGSTGTQAGLVTGLVASNAGLRVLGVSVRAPRAVQETAVYRLAQRTREHLGIRGEVPRDAVEVNDGHVGAGYGLPTDGAIEAIALAARLEGLLLDPVYTGKAMAGLIALARTGELRKGENVLFLHTGGAVGLFGYREELTESVRA